MNLEIFVSYDSVCYEKRGITIRTGILASDFAQSEGAEREHLVNKLSHGIAEVLHARFKRDLSKKAQA